VLSGQVKAEEEERMRIEVLGTGCAKCEKVEEVVRRAVAEAGVDAEVVKVKDIREILKYKVMMTPAVAVDGVVKIAGRVPAVDEVKALLVG
jgi:small redox-active disulfide protein 2